MSCNHTADRRLMLDTLLIMEIYKWNLKYPSHLCYDDVYNQTDITSRALKNTENHTHQPFARTNSNRGFYWLGVAAPQLLNFWDHIVVSSLCGHISLSQSHLNENCGSPRPIELEVSAPKPDTWAEGGGPNNRLLEKPSLKEKEGPVGREAQTGSVTRSNSVSWELSHWSYTDLSPNEKKTS